MHRGIVMEECKLVLEVDLNVEDLYRFQKEIFYKKLSPGGLSAIGILFLLMAICSIIRKPPFGIDPILTMLLILLPLIFLITVPLALKKVAIRNFNTSKLLHKTQKYQIGNEGIEISSESGQAFIKWNELYMATETKDGFRFFISEQLAYIVPKRCFDQDEEIVKLLRSYIKNAPIPKGDKKKRFSMKNIGIGCLVVYILLFLAVLVVFYFI